MLVGCCKCIARVSATTISVVTNHPFMQPDITELDCQGLGTSFTQFSTIPARNQVFVYLAPVSGSLFEHLYKTLILTGRLRSPQTEKNPLWTFQREFHS